MSFPGGSVVKNLLASAGDEGSIPGLGRSLGRHGNPLQYSCLENSMDRGAWQAAVHGVTKSQTQGNYRSSCCLPCDFPGGSDGKRICLQFGRPGLNPWVGKIPWRRKWQPTPVFLPGESHRQRNLMGCSPWDCKESDVTERLTVSLHLPL